MDRRRCRSGRRAIGSSSSRALSKSRNGSRALDQFSAVDRDVKYTSAIRVGVLTRRRCTALVGERRPDTRLAPAAPGGALLDVTFQDFTDPSNSFGFQQMTTRRLHAYSGAARRLGDFAARSAAGRACQVRRTGSVLLACCRRSAAATICAPTRAGGFAISPVPLQAEWRASSTGSLTWPCLRHRRVSRTASTTCNWRGPKNDVGIGFRFTDRWRHRCGSTGWRDSRVFRWCGLRPTPSECATDG